MKKIVLSGAIVCLFWNLQSVSAAYASREETRQLFIRLLFSTGSPDKPLLEMRMLQESPEKTVRMIRMQIARSLGIWPSLIKANDRKGCPLSDHLKIGYEIGESPRDPLRLLVDVGVPKIGKQAMPSDFVDSTFLQ